MPVRNWIARRGGLSSEMKFLHGRMLRALAPPCKQGVATIGAGRTTRPLSGRAALEHEILELARRTGFGL